MVKYLLAIAILIVLSCSVHAQDIPLFSQKLTNSFIYNPAMAGVGMGSLTFSHRNNYSGVNGAPNNNFISLHTPFSNYRFGAGINVFQEQVTYLKSTYASAAFAYHININKFSTLSFGVSGEYNSSRLSDEASLQNIGNDLVLSQYSNGVGTPDYSFGMHYQTRLWRVGISANRLKTAWFEKDSTKTLVSYYTGFVQGTIPLGDGKSVLEPYAAYRKLSESSDIIDIGLYYNYNNKITAGIATRSGSILSGTLAYNVTPKLLVGYSREMILGSVGGYTGSSNEFVLRLDFANRANKKAFRADYKNAMAYRTKSVTKTSISSTRSGSKSNPKQLHKSQKKLAPYSPSSRYQNTKKLSSGKKVSAPKSKYKAKKSKYGTGKKKKGGSAFRKNKYNPARKK